MNNEVARITPWDVFINLLAVIALYVASYASMSMMSHLIAFALPEVDDVGSRIYDGIRYDIALIFIFFPAYVWAWRAIAADRSAVPSKNSSWVVTCPIYLTLFVSGLMVLIDLACAVYYFLTGELTVRFLLTLLSILSVGAAVLTFYRNELRRSPGPLSRGMTLFSYGSTLAAAVLVVAGIAIAGSPRRARDERMDGVRIENLQDIQEQIIGYWRAKQALPPALDNLNDSIAGKVVPTDPITDESYAYRITGAHSFELCANFALAGNPNDRYPAWESAKIERGKNWAHGPGHTCFAREIDPVKYPHLKPCP